jgi:hypothetical protein
LHAVPRALARAAFVQSRSRQSSILVPPASRPPARASRPRRPPPRVRARLRRSRASSRGPLRVIASPRVVDIESNRIDRDRSSRRRASRRVVARRGGRRRSFARSFDRAPVIARVVVVARIVVAVEMCGVDDARRRAISDRARARAS